MLTRSTSLGILVACALLTGLVYAGSAAAQVVAAKAPALTLSGAVRSGATTLSTRPAAEEPGNPPPMLGPTFTVDVSKAGTPFKVIGYGDTRFTNPSNTRDTNPRMRKFLVDRIAEEKPDALFETGDLPMIGSDPADWANFREETEPWRRASLRVFPTIGNHEVTRDYYAGLRNYLAAFPELKGCRYYSALLGNVYLVSLDASLPVVTGGREQVWLISQLEHLPDQVDFVFFLDHMPLVADLQSEIAVRLPGKEESDLRILLEHEKAKTRAKFIILSGHIHNYERYERAGISYIVSGGGGALPYPIFVRGREDLYRDTRFPVFNYVVFLVRGAHIDATMYRVDQPLAARPKMEVGERFTLDAAAAR